MTFKRVFLIIKIKISFELIHKIQNSLDDSKNDEQRKKSEINVEKRIKDQIIKWAPKKECLSNTCSLKKSSKNVLIKCILDTGVFALNHFELDPNSTKERYIIF